MKNFWMRLMFVLAMMLLVSCSDKDSDTDDWNDDAEVSSNKGNKDNQDDQEKESPLSQMIASIGKESVTVEIGEIEKGRFGGFIGTGEDVNITNCYNEANIAVKTRQGGRLGGICGDDAFVANCFNTGSISMYTTAAILKIAIT